ncbi:hypothetical protein C8R43DRAFT_889585 [Mycena crocata]|nr:hypothetical protein C8R43DRAFT_889585 [Mycena crocata]
MATSQWYASTHPTGRESSEPTQFWAVMDATRTEDGLPVMLKKIEKAAVSAYINETTTGLYFSTPPRAAHPRNHCVPIYEVLQVPDNIEHEIIVMPALRKLTSPPFDTFGEVVECLRQIFQAYSFLGGLIHIGIQFMHAHNVAHRDCSSLNIMMDATRMYPNGFHPRITEKNRNYRGKARYTTRTACNPKYYLIDFGISGMYNPTDGPPLDYGIRGGDRTLPEFLGADYRNELHNPFPTDVYYLGNMLKREFIEGYRGFEFMQTLVQDMVADNPTKRPTIDEVVMRFDKIRRSLSTWKLRSRPIPRKEIQLVTLFRAIPHWFRRIGYILRGIPAVPIP